MLEIPWREAAAVALSALPLLAGAQAPEPSRTFLYVEDPEKWGRPSRVVVPEYPRSALERGHTGHVDIEGTIDPLRDLRNPVFKPDSDASSIFVAAVKEVLPSWEFHPARDRDCIPSPARVTTRVWFEIADGKPKISVALRSAPPVPFRINAVHRELPVYPRSMQRDGRQAYVYVRMEVDAAGDVGNVEAKAFSDSQRGHAAFERESARVMRRWKYEPLPEGETRVRVVCNEVLFRFGN